MVNGYAQYDGGSSTDFELHPLEEGNLVLKILQSSGLAMKDVGLYQAATQEEMKNITGGLPLPPGMKLPF